MSGHRLASLVQRLDQERPGEATPLGWRCFQLGMVFLASSALIAALFLLVALILGSRKRARPWWGDRCNRVLALVGALMLLGAVQVSLPGFALQGYQPVLAWLGLANWLPLFWGFWGFQPYVLEAAARRRVALCLVAGTVPVLVTGLGQLWLGWSGPWQILGGAVVWWLGPGGNPPGRLSGLFDYANITAAWLALSWPLALAALLEAARRWRQRPAWLLPTAVLLVLAQVAALYLTDSRNAWGALLLAVPIVLGPTSWPWLLPLLLLGLLPVLIATLPGVPGWLQEPARQLVPQSIWGRLNDANAHGQRPAAITRLSQWSTAVGLIAERPWFGWGAAAFSVIYPLRTGFWHGHAHNIGLDLALSSGIPAALALVGFVLWLLIRGLHRGMARGPVFERAWWAAALVLAALHATDIPMYDSRINIAGWILLAGLRCYR
ncbi:MAG: O-antigen ligase family protein, partial [Vulcanococcus sp.]